TFTQLLRNWASQKKASHLQNTHQIPTTNLFNKHLGLTQGNCINIFQAFASGFCGVITTKQTPTNPHLHMFTNPSKKKRKRGGGESTHQAQTTTPTQKNRGSNLLSHPPTGQYHQRKKTSRPTTKRDRR